MDFSKCEAVLRFPILRAYLEHFGLTSLKNPIPGLLSFFFIQGQCAVKYVRLPTGDSYLDPRVHVFWIQPSRSGKSIAWNFIGDILNQLDLKSTLYTTGTDAGLVGSFETIEHGTGKDKTYEKVPTEGLLAGQKALNFDEGSIILNPGKFSQETVLYLQSACNPIGTENNKLVKHMKDGVIENESLVSMWITTYPPKGVKEYVLTRGIFQRVLLFWGSWDMDKRQQVSNLRLSTFFKKPKEIDISKQDIYDYFNNLQKRLRDKVLELSEISFVAWDAYAREEQEEVIQNVMWDMFTADDDFETALHQSAEGIYTLVRDMDPSLSEVIASFIPGVENYLGIFSLHLAMMDESWEVKAEYVDMAYEILYALFKNLITWLEDEVDVGMKEAQKTHHINNWIKAYDATAETDLEGRGPHWRRKSVVSKQYMAITGVSSNTASRHFNLHGQKIFNVAKVSTSVFIRLKTDSTEMKKTQTIDTATIASEEGDMIYQQMLQEVEGE